jgi:hypothetical protein
VENTVALERQQFHHRSRYEIARKLAGDPEEARRIVKDIAACRAEFIVTDEAESAASPDRLRIRSRSVRRDRAL